MKDNWVKILIVFLVIIVGAFGYLAGFYQRLSKDQLAINRYQVKNIDGIIQVFDTATGKLFAYGVKVNGKMSLDTCIVVDLISGVHWTKKIERKDIFDMVEKNAKR